MNWPTVYVKGRRISHDKNQERDHLTGLRRKSEGSPTTGTKSFPKRCSLPGGQALLDHDECFKDFTVGDFEKEASYFLKVILEKEKSLAAFDANQEYEEEEGIRYRVQNNGNHVIYDNKQNADRGKALSSDVGNNRQEEDNRNMKEKSAGKTRLCSLKEEGEKQRHEGVEQLFEKNFDLVKVKRQDQDQTRKDFLGQRRKSEELISTRACEYLPKSPAPEDLALLDSQEAFERTRGFIAGDVEKGEEEREKGIDETTYGSEGESDTESFFNVKGEMLSLFNKLEANASFLHSMKDQDLESTTPEAEELSRNDDDHSLVREMEAIFDELKQQQDENEDSSSSHSKGEQESDAQSFFDMSNEIEDITSKFDKCSVGSKSSDIQKTSGDEPSLMSTPKNSSDSDSFFHIQSELESRLQDPELHCDDFDEDSQGRNDEISEGVSSDGGSYFNMQNEVEMRLNLINHGNVI